MSARIQRPPRNHARPALLAAVLFVAGFAAMVVMIVTAHLLVAVASWAYSVVGAWAWLPVVALVAWVGWAEKRRWAR